MPKVKTYNEGANDERTAIMAKLRRDQGKANRYWDEGPVANYLTGMIDWLMGRTKRAGQAPGGIGRKILKPTAKTRPAVKARREKCS